MPSGLLPTMRSAALLAVGFYRALGNHAISEFRTDPTSFGFARFSVSRGDLHKNGRSPHDDSRLASLGDSRR
jgi:hypothetical protein